MCGLADMDIGRREELGSELNIGVEGLSITSKSFAERVCRVTDLRLCLEDCYSDGRTDKLTSCTMNTWHVGKQCAWCTHARGRPHAHARGNTHAHRESFAIRILNCITILT